MSTDDGNYNGSESPLHQLVQEDAHATRAAALANKFVEDYFDRFAEAEMGDDRFVLDIPDFDAWLVKQNMLPADSSDSDQNDGDGEDDIPIASRGKASLRQEARQTINRAARFGKGVWPPFEIAKYVTGKSYEVRLLTRMIQKIPEEHVQKLLRRVVNQDAHFAHAIRFINSDEVQAKLKDSPAATARFNSLEGSVRLTMGNMAHMLQALYEHINGMHREARQLIKTSL